MPQTQELKLVRGEDRVYRTGWIDDLGLLHGEEFGTDRNAARVAFDAFNRAWQLSNYVRRKEEEPQVGAPPPDEEPAPSGVQILAVTDDPRDINYARWYPSSVYDANNGSIVNLIASGLAGSGSQIAVVGNCIVIDYGAATLASTYYLASEISPETITANLVMCDGLQVTDLTQTGTVAARTVEAKTDTTWVCPATVGVININGAGTFNGQTAGDYIVAPGATYTVVGTVNISYLAGTLCSPAVTQVSTAVPDSHAYWDFSNVFSVTPSVGDVACLQCSDGSSWMTPSAVTVRAINGANTRLELEYSDAIAGSWRINGSTAGLAFAGGGSLLTGVSGSIS